MGQVNAVSPGVGSAQSARGGAADITLMAQSNNPTAAGNTDLGQGVVQGLGPDGKTVYAAKLVMRVYDGSGKTRYYANGKALPASIIDESAARTFARQQIAKGTLGELPRAAKSNAKSTSQRTPAAPPKVPERLKAIAHGGGEVGLRDKNGDTLATTLKAREFYRDGQWRNDGFVAERMSAYSATSKAHNAQPEANGYGYFQAEHGKMRLITGRDGRVITELPQARARAGEMMRYGGLTMTTDAQAQTAQKAKAERQESLRGISQNGDGSLRKTTLTQWKPVIPLPKPIEKMDHVDRVKYMVREAIRVAPASAKKELQGLLTPQNLAAMAAFTGAQFLPGLNVVADGIAVILLGKEVVDTTGKFGGAIYKALTATGAFDLAAAGSELSQAVVHMAAAGVMVGGGLAVRGLAGKSTSPKATRRQLESTLQQHAKGKATPAQVNEARIAANNAHKGLTKPEQRLQRDVRPEDFKRWKQLSAQADAVVSRAAPHGPATRNSKVRKSQATQSSSVPFSLKPVKPQTTQQNRPPDLTPLPNPSKVLEPKPLPAPSKVLTPSQLKPKKQETVQQSQQPELKPLPREASVAMAIKMKNFGQNARAIANPTLYNTFLSLLDGQAISTLVRVGVTGATEFVAKGLKERSDQYRNAGINNLKKPDDFYAVQMSPGKAMQSHNAHTVFGSVSKLGEVNANSGAFALRKSPWASRGELPGQNGKPVAKFWNVDKPGDWKDAEAAVAWLERANPQLSQRGFADRVETLSAAGFIPKGSALAVRLERLETAIAQRDLLQRQFKKADPAQVPALQGPLRAAVQKVQDGLSDFANQATQSRRELLTQSLGTPKTTYELTIRHAAAARYMLSMEGQGGAIFSAPKFKAFMAEVKKEATQAGSEVEVSLLWHRELIKTYGKDATFQKAMQQSPAMREAWAAYRTQYGL